MLPGMEVDLTPEWNLLDFAKVIGGLIVGGSGGAWLLRYLQTRARLKLNRDRENFDQDERRSEQRRTDMEGVVTGWQDMLAETREEVRSLKAEQKKTREAHEKEMSAHLLCEAKLTTLQGEVASLRAENAGLRARVEMIENGQEGRNSEKELS